MSVVRSKEIPDTAAANAELTTAREASRKDHKPYETRQIVLDQPVADVGSIAHIGHDDLLREGVRRIARIGYGGTGAGGHADITDGATRHQLRPGKRHLGKMQMVTIVRAHRVAKRYRRTFGQLGIAVMIGKRRNG